MATPNTTIPVFRFGDVFHVIGEAKIPLKDMTRSQRNAHRRAYAKAFPKIDRREKLNTKLDGPSSRIDFRVPTAEEPHVDTSRDKHYTIQQLSKLWGCHPNTIIRLADEETEGIIRLGTVKITRLISDTAMQRMYCRLSRKR